MPRPKSSLPSYSHQKSNNRARCWVNGKWITLGEYNSPESRAEYARILAELAASPAGATVGEIATVAPTVDEVILAFWKWAEQHYRRPDGTQTNQVVELRCALRPLHSLYGHTRACDFGPLALKAVRAEMLKLDWCRSQVNARVGKVKRVFKWAAGEELVPATVFTALGTVEGLQKGRTKARETEPIGPVDPAHVAATLPALPPAVRGIVQFQRLTGCRPGEACRLRAPDIDRSGAVWVYRLEQHKTAHEGKERVVAIGPRAQEMLRPFIKEDGSFFFDPREERASAGERYTSHSYSVAIRRAAKRACVPHWHPNQLRHWFATEARRLHGLEAAQVLLGHARADITQVYAEKNLALAQQVALLIG